MIIKKKILLKSDSPIRNNSDFLSADHGKLCINSILNHNELINKIGNLYSYSYSLNFMFEYYLKRNYNSLLDYVYVKIHDPNGIGHWYAGFFDFKRKRIIILNSLNYSFTQHKKNYQKMYILKIFQKIDINTVLSPKKKTFSVLPYISKKSKNEFVRIFYIHIPYKSLKPQYARESFFSFFFKKMRKTEKVFFLGESTVTIHKDSD